MMDHSGPTGNGISSIAKTSTSGLVDTYTITYTNGTTTTYEVTNGEDGEVTQAQLDEVIARQNRILANTPSGTTNTNPAYMNDSADLPLNKFVLKGKTEQFTTTGKQMLDTIVGRTGEGYTMINDNKGIIVNMSTSNDRYFFISNTFESPLSKTYTLAFEVSGMVDTSIPFTLWGGGTIFNLKNGRNVCVLPQDTVLNLNQILWDDQNPSSRNSILTFTNFMLVEGEYTEETMPDYEPYTRWTSKSFS